MTRSHYIQVVLRKSNIKVAIISDNWPQTQNKSNIDGVNMNIIRPLALVSGNI